MRGPKIFVWFLLGWGLSVACRRVVFHSGFLVACRRVVFHSEFLVACRRVVFHSEFLVACRRVVFHSEFLVACRQAPTLKQRSDSRNSAPILGRSLPAGDLTL